MHSATFRRGGPLFEFLRVKLEETPGRRDESRLLRFLTRLERGEDGVQNLVHYRSLQVGECIAGFSSPRGSLCDLVAYDCPNFGSKRRDSRR